MEATLCACNSRTNFVNERPALDGGMLLTDAWVLSMTTIPLTCTSFYDPTSLLVVRVSSALWWDLCHTVHLVFYMCGFLRGLFYVYGGYVFAQSNSACLKSCCCMAPRGRVGYGVLSSCCCSYCEWVSGGIYVAW